MIQFGSYFSNGLVQPPISFYITRISQNITEYTYPYNISHSKMGPISPRGSSGCVGDGRSSPFGPLERWHGHHGGGAGGLDFCHQQHLPTMNASHWRYVICFVAQAHHLRKTTCQGQKALLLRFNLFFSTWSTSLLLEHSRHKVVCHAMGKLMDRHLLRVEAQQDNLTNLGKKR